MKTTVAFRLALIAGRVNKAYSGMKTTVAFRPHRTCLATSYSCTKLLTSNA